jgi:hypothetical protein
MNACITLAGLTVMTLAMWQMAQGVDLVKVPAPHCATLLYTGSVAGLGDAFGKLYGDIGRQGLEATDVCREVYLYWEGRESPNNIIQIQAELAQK